MTNSRNEIKCALCNLSLQGRGRRGRKPITGNVICVDCGNQLRKKCGLCGEHFSPTALKGTRFSYCLSCARSYSKSYNKSKKTIVGALSERECLWCLKSFMPKSVRSKCCSHNCNTAHNQFVKYSGEWNRCSKLMICVCGKLISHQYRHCPVCRGAQCSIDGCDDIVRSNGLCNAHYIRSLRGMDMKKPRGARKYRCSFDGCAKPQKAEGLCLFHLRRQKRGISLDTPHGYRIPNPPKLPKLCGHPGCERKHHGKGLCSFHYGRLINGQDLDRPFGREKKYTNEICLVENCGRPHAGRGKGLCKTHYRAKYGRKYKNGLHWLSLGERDGWVCHLCGWVVEQSAGTWKNPNGATVDHLIPRSKGGPDEWDNVRLAHYKCNHERSDQDLDLVNGDQY